jgi:hypothetical protein
MNREWQVQVVALILYAAIIIRMDKAGGLRMAAGWYLRGSHLMRDVSNWSGTTAIRWENAAKELVSP